MRWTGIGYIDLPGTHRGRARWKQLPIAVEITAGDLALEVNVPVLRRFRRRTIHLDDLVQVQDADVTSGRFLPGVRIVGSDGSVGFIWFRRAREVRAALAEAGIPVCPPVEDSSPGYRGRSQYEV